MLWGNQIVITTRQQSGYNATSQHESTSHNCILRHWRQICEYHERERIRMETSIILEECQEILGRRPEGGEATRQGPQGA